jgi:hypothetical protein
MDTAAEVEWPIQLVGLADNVASARQTCHKSIQIFSVPNACIGICFIRQELVNYENRQISVIFVRSHDCTHQAVQEITTKLSKGCVGKTWAEMPNYGISACVFLCPRFVL